MSMSRKNYIAVAAVMKAALDRVLGNPTVSQGAETALIRRIVFSLADGFAEDNERFDPVRFIEACGFEVPLIEEDEEPTPEHLDRYIEHVYGSDYHG